MNMKNIFLYGPPGSGKTKVGKILASNLNRVFFDLDNVIEDAAGRTITEIIVGHGESAFRDLETQAIQKVSSKPGCVIALGGGALLREGNRAIVESGGELVVLDADITTLLHRLKTEPDQRPLLIGDLDKKLTGLLALRESHYKSVGMRVATNALQPEAIASMIQQRLGLFYVGGMGSGYDIVIREGEFELLSEYLTTIESSRMIVVVSDTNVGPIYGEKVLISLRKIGKQPRLLTIPAGEQFKTIETVSSLWRGFLSSSLDRGSIVIALGGGVVGDLTGFAASTYMRGIRWICLPTTLLAMVDASIGGKTGFDLPEGKNLVGAFHSPSLILSDPGALVSLPEEDFKSGLAEVVKHGIISDPSLFDLCSRGLDAIKPHQVEVLSRAIAVKVNIIKNDPYEREARASLNYGHTVGHALEKLSDYYLRHGDAVAIGMVVEARLAERLKLASSGLSETITATLKGLGLPVVIPPDMAMEDIYKAMQHDKKKDSGIIRFALPVNIGDVRFGVEISESDFINSEM